MYPPSMTRTNPQLMEPKSTSGISLLNVVPLSLPLLPLPLPLLLLLLPPDLRIMLLSVKYAADSAAALGGR
jgi:hypothetical protein